MVAHISIIPITMLLMNIPTFQAHSTKNVLFANIFLSDVWNTSDNKQNIWQSSIFRQEFNVKR